MAGKSSTPTETDSTYFLKIVVFVLLAALWVRFRSPIQIGNVLINGFPLGLLAGLIVASREPFQVDRKVEYAIIVLVTVLTFFLPIGIFL